MNNFTTMIMEDGTLSYTSLVGNTGNQVPTVYTPPEPIEMTMEAPDPKIPRPPDAFCVVCRQGIRTLIDPWSNTEDCMSGTSQTKMVDFIVNLLDPKSLEISAVSI